MPSMYSSTDSEYDDSFINPVRIKEQRSTILDIRNIPRLDVLSANSAQIRDAGYKSADLKVGPNHERSLRQLSVRGAN